MTFRELENIIVATGRKGDTLLLLSLLLDYFDNGIVCVDIDTVMAETGLKNANISAVTNRLKDLGALTILYKDIRNDDSLFSEVRNGRWSKAYYKLPPAILQLYRRG